MKLSSLLTSRVRGFRVVDLAAAAVFLSLALTVYAVKTSAGAERTDIADVESQIRDESRQVRVLRGEVAHMESPAQLEPMARDYANQAPVNAAQEITPENLSQVAAGGGRP